VFAEVLERFFDGERDAADHPRPLTSGPALRSNQAGAVSEENSGSGYVTSGSSSGTPNYITDRITADGRRVAVEAGRYRLVVARRARGPTGGHRARLLGLEDAISMGICGPTTTSAAGPSTSTPAAATRCSGTSGCRRPSSPGTRVRRGITVPAMVDVPTKAVVTNDFADDAGLLHRVDGAHRDGAPDLYPEKLRDEMDEVMQRVYTEVNNGVYRCGFAGLQRAYDRAYDAAVDALDWLEERLSGQRYLMGDTITEADVRLFTTLARFDPVYHGHFKANRQKLTEMPVLWAYARDLFQTPGVRRHDRLPADQGALLRRPRGHQPDPGRPGRVPTPRTG
jgi:putative glutathione S-transferase